MELSTITVDIFKDHFYRDFPYLPEYDAAEIYNTDDVVYYSVTRLFYKGLYDGLQGVAPNAGPLSYDQGKKYDSGLKYDQTLTAWSVYRGQSKDNYICDRDIIKAFSEAQRVFNQELFSQSASPLNWDSIGDWDSGVAYDPIDFPPGVVIPYLYLTAHFLCNDINAARAGIASVGSFPVQSRSVGSVSEAYAVPKAYTESALLAIYTRTSYGLKYLAMVLPNLVGNMAGVRGGTNP